MDKRNRPTPQEVAANTLALRLRVEATLKGVQMKKEARRNGYYWLYIHRNGHGVLLAPYGTSEPATRINSGNLMEGLIDRAIDGVDGEGWMIDPDTAEIAAFWGCFED